MLEGDPFILYKMVGATAVIMIFIRLFARRMPQESGTVTPTPLPSDRMLGPYRVLETIGVGGNATVYKAKSAEGQTVAIKIPHLETLRVPNFRKTFNAEADVGVNLQHPSIVRVMGVGEIELKSGKRKVPFFVMEFLEGEDLAARLEREGCLPPGESAQIARVVADALGWAHHRGIIHRDISPKNIFITSGRQVKVMDFGISTVFKTDRGGSAQGGGINFGTPAYLAPERTSRSDNDPRSDLYSLGCVLYEMLTGKPPFQAETAKAVLMLHRKAPVPPPSSRLNLPAELEAVVLKLLEKNPEKRFQNASQVAAALADLQPAV